MIIILFLMVIIASVALNAFVLHISTKIFKVNGASYKTALIVSALQGVATLIIVIIVGIILSNFGIGNLGNILSILIGFFIFHKLLQKYYHTNLKKNIAIYIILIIITVVVSLVIIVPTRIFVIEPFYNKGDAMVPTYQDKDYLLIKKFDKNYERGAIVVFKNPKKPEEYFIKRIIGLPGEKVQIKEGSVYLYDKQNPNGYKLSEQYLSPDIKTFGLDENILEIANNEYYMLGDNRPVSKDSRSIGPVSSNYITGKVWFKGN